MTELAPADERPNRFLRWSRVALLAMVAISAAAWVGKIVVAERRDNAESLAVQRGISDRQTQIIDALAEIRKRVDGRQAQRDEVYAYVLERMTTVLKELRNLQNAVECRSGDERVTTNAKPE